MWKTNKYPVMGISADRNALLVAITSRSVWADGKFTQIITLYNSAEQKSNSLCAPSQTSWWMNYNSRRLVREGLKKTAEDGTNVAWSFFLVINCPISVNWCTAVAIEVASECIFHTIPRTGLRTTTRGDAEANETVVKAKQRWQNNIFMWPPVCDHIVARQIIYWHLWQQQ